MSVVRNCLNCGPVLVDSEGEMTRVDEEDGDWYVVCPDCHEETGR